MLDWKDDEGCLFMYGIQENYMNPWAGSVLFVPDLYISYPLGDIRAALT